MKESRDRPAPIILKNWSWTPVDVISILFAVALACCHADDWSDIPVVEESTPSLVKPEKLDRSQPLAAADSAKSENNPAWKVGYDGGFRIRPVDPEKNPFELRVNGRMQFRHTGFIPDVSQWTDNAGVSRPVATRNDFEIERGRLEFRGFFRDPKLQFFMNIDSDTDDNHRLVFHDVWINYAFSKSFDLYFGKSFVPGVRDWLNGSLNTRLADRSMATTFFRPDRSVGVWILGEPVDGCFYRAMISNGFNTQDLAADEIDDRLCYSASMWKEVGEYGRGYSDVEWHASPAFIFGHSCAYVANGTDANELPSTEVNFVRLSDGTRLTAFSALAPGVQVNQFSVFLYAVDFALKYRGFSANGEYYLRWIESIRGNGPLPVNGLFEHGFYAEAGYMLVPKRLEFNVRTSQVFGDYGIGREYAVGVNWFFKGSHEWKFTIDLTRLIRNPADNTGANYRAGDDGVMLRTQIQTAF